ncbi:hypothetical protein DCO57_15065 [Labrenzia sp. 011]|nr:hypothetical protein DCO57_15065 [Labrenzia sp. 011]
MTLGCPRETSRHGGVELGILIADRGCEIGTELAGHHVLDIAALAHIADLRDVIPVGLRGGEHHPIEQRHARTQDAGRMFEERFELLNMLTGQALHIGRVDTFDVHSITLRILQKLVVVRNRARIPVRASGKTIPLSRLRPHRDGRAVRFPDSRRTHATSRPSRDIRLLARLFPLPVMNSFTSG